jgi:hypothetical protein
MPNTNGCFDWIFHGFDSGGYKLELLDPNGKLIETLTPENGGSNGDGWIDDDATAQRHLIKLPDAECAACTVSSNCLCG